MRVLFLGDIFGRPGRHAVGKWLGRFRARESIDFVIANAENAAGGKGITVEILHELLDMGIEVLTGGNHSFSQRESLPLFNEDPRLLRPANLPPGAPGRGVGIYESAAGVQVAVINLQGRAFMTPSDCPFRRADQILAELAGRAGVIIVDFHAEATSEKMAMAHYLDGRVAAVIGTHTHVPTADARVSPAGTAAVSDVGMCGPFDSVIGVQSRIIIDHMLTGVPARHQVARHDARVCAALIHIDPAGGRARRIEQIIEPPFKTRTGAEGDQ